MDRKKRGSPSKNQICTINDQTEINLTHNHRNDFAFDYRFGFLVFGNFRLSQSKNLFYFISIRYILNELQIF